MKFFEFGIFHGSAERSAARPVSEYNGDDKVEIYENKCLHISFTGGFSKVWQAHQILQQYALTNDINLSDRIYEVYKRDMSVDVYYVISNDY